MNRPPASLLLLAAASIVGCSDDPASAELTPPVGVTCTSVVSAGTDAASLTSALEGAEAGDCVVAPANAVYEGNFSVKTGVKLVAQNGGRARLQGIDPEDATLELFGGEGSLLQGFDVVANVGGNGVIVRGEHADLVGVHVTGAVRAGIAVVGDASPTTPDTRVALDAVVLDGNGIGLWASAARVTLTGAVISHSGGTGLTSGIGALAVDGAALEMSGATTIEANSYGVLLDGAATTARLDGVQVLGNTERGIWAQGLVGTAAAPSLVIEGAATRIEGNHVVGLGLLATTGVVVTGVEIRSTVATPVSIGLEETALIGDGIGIFGGSAEVSIDAVRFEGNERCQVLVDQGGEGLSITGGEVLAGAGQLKVVVQATDATVTVPADYLSTTAEPLAVVDDLVATADVTD